MREVLNRVYKIYEVHKSQSCPCSKSNFGHIRDQDEVIIIVIMELGGIILNF